MCPGDIRAFANIVGFNDVRGGPERTGHLLAQQEANNSLAKVRICTEHIFSKI